jgi:hypothetical protein
MVVGFARRINIVLRAHRVEKNSLQIEKGLRQMSGLLLGQKGDRNV